MISITTNKPKAGIPGIKYLWLLVLLVFCPGSYVLFSPLHGQGVEPLASGELTVLGVRLEIDPVQQTVPINTGTVVNTVFSVDSPELLEGMVVKGTLTGPGITGAITLTTLPNHPFAIPGFTSRGTYTLENIHLEKDGKVLLAAAPDQAVIEAMDIIVTKVETRPLTLEEIREKGIVISQENFSVYNFSVGFIVNSEEVTYNFPIVYSGNNEVYIPSGQGGGQGPGAILGREKPEPIPISFDLPELDLPINDIEPKETSRPLSGVVIFNNDIAFLNQFFSVMFIVSNHAPEGSPLTLKNLSAKITFPAGLREAQTNPPHLVGAAVPVRCPGQDGKIGTADDLDIIMATFSGMAEFLAEGLKEGNHMVNIDFAGTLAGLPGGDTPVSGKAAGAVIVRNPEFGITFAHPAVIRKGEEYDIYVTMTNTSPVAANLVSLTMPATRLVGTSVLSDETVSFETLASGESVTARFHMRSHETGKIRASAFEADGPVAGKFVLTAGVGEQGIPLSPDTLVLPDWSYSLPNPLIDASLLLLGEAYSIATTPPGGLPGNLPYISAAVVKDRALEFAEAGQRYTYGDTLLKTLEVLTLDWLGSQRQDLSFDILRRLTTKGLTLAQQQALYFNEALASQTAQEFQYAFTRDCSYKPPFISALLSFGSGSRTSFLRITDYYGNRLSAENGVSGLIRHIPYGELYIMEDQNQGPVDFALIGHPEENSYQVEVTSEASGSFDLALIVPDSSGGFRQVVFSGVACQPGSVAIISIKPTDTVFTLAVDSNGDGEADTQVPGSVIPVQAPPLQLLGAVQECDADPAGHATALFFNRPVDPLTAKDKANYQVEGKSVYASYRQPSGRVVLIGTDNPISPFVESRVRVENLIDLSGGPLTPSPVEMPIQATIKTPGGIVYGQVFTATGQSLANAKIQLVEVNGNARNLSFAISDSSGNFQFDFVRILNDPFTIEVFDPLTGKVERVGSRLMGNGQRLRIDVVMRGRGTINGKVMDTAGIPVSSAGVSAQAQSTATPGGGAWEYFSAVTGKQGEYLIQGIPLGRVSLKAGAGGKYGTASTALTAPGEIQTVDITVAAGKTAAVSGRVLFSDGITPVAQTYVNVYGENNFANGTQTDEQGYFQFPVVPLGTFYVEAFDPLTGNKGGQANGELVEGQGFNTTIILRGTGRVYGKVVDHNGLPLAGVLVYIPNSPFFMDTDSSGEFNFPVVPVGTYSVTAYNRSTNATVTGTAKVLSEGQETYVALVFANPLNGSIGGTVYGEDGITPLPYTDVFAADEHHIGRGTCQSNGSGHFQIDNLDPGNYIVVAVRGGTAGISNTTIQSPGHQALCNVQLVGKGSVNINVLASDGQTGIIADVTLWRLVFALKEGDMIGFRGQQDSYSTDENGHLLLEDVYVGGISVTARNEFYPRGATYNGKISSPGQVVDVNLVMRPTGKVTLHVKSWDNETPVPGAALEFNGDFLNYKGIYSDENGDFEFTLVPPGSFHITAEDPVSGLKGICYGTMGQDGDLVEVTLRLRGTGLVNGVVKTQSGALVANANVTVKNIGFPNQTFGTTTAEDGHFSISGVWEGDFTVSAYDPLTHTGGVSRGEIPGHNAQANVEVLLDPIGTVQGKVLSPDGGTEITNVQVVLYHSKFYYGAVGYSYVSQPGGYTFENIPKGQFYLEALHPASGRKGKIYGTLTSEGEIKLLDVRLEGRGTVTGTFFDGSGVNPVPHASIKIISSGRYPFTQSSSTDAQGHFTFREVGQGAFSLEAVDPANGLVGRASSQVEFDEQVVEIDVLAQGWGSVGGTVYNADGSIDTSQARIALTQGLKTYSAYAAPGTGQYHIDFVPTGSFTVSAYRQPGERDYGTATGRVEFHGQEAVVNITFKGLGRVTGKVLDGSGNPVGGIPVTLRSGKEIFTVGSGNNAGTTGEYLFQQIRMGTFSLEAKEPGTGLAASTNGELTTDGQVITLDLTLESAGSVSGRILMPDGVTPAENAYLTLKGSNFSKYFNTGPGGEFTFNAVRLGSFTVNAQGYNNGGKARAAGQVSSNGDLVELGDLVLDLTTPEVTGFSPVNGSSVVPLNSTVTVQFSEAMYAGSITATTVKLITAGGTTVAGSAALAPDLKTVVFTPASPLASFILYTLVVDGTVEDAAGNQLGNQASASFTTSDIEPPLLTTINPGGNAVGVPIDTVVTLTFNEPVDSGNFTTQNLAVSKAGVPVAGILGFSAGNTVVVFTPAALASDSQYKVTLQGVRDVTGNTQTVPFSSYFYTIDTIAPTLQLLPPAQGLSLIEGRQAEVTADTGSATDIAVVHFFLNGKLTKSDTASPYNYTFTVPAQSEVGSTFLVEAQAVDKAGNSSSKVQLAFNILADKAPQITLTGPAQPAIFPGSTISCSVTASDDLGLDRVTLTARGGTLQYDNTFSFVTASKTFSKNYTIAVPLELLPGTEIVLHAEVEDTHGNLAKAKDIVLFVPQDEQNPVVTIISPSPGSRFQHNQDVDILAEAVDDVGIKEVRIYLDDRLLATHTQAPYTATFPVPPLDEEQAAVVKVEAEDLAGKVSQAAVDIVLEQLVDLTAPQVKILTPSDGTLVFADENLKIKIDAIDDEGVKTVAIFADGQLLQTLSQAPYEFTYLIPATAAAGSTITLKAVATDVDKKTGTAQSVLEVVTGTILPGGTVIAADNPAYDNQTIIIREGTVTVNGQHTFVHVLLKESGILTHATATTADLYKMELTVTGKFVVGPDAVANVDGRGYLGGYRGGSGSPYGRTLGNTSGSYYYSGGGYGGYGGKYNSYAVNESYGSLYEPADPGSGGGGLSPSNPGGNGGGVMRIEASQLIDDGTISANGYGATGCGAGSGGSIRLKVTTLKGSGTITARGGNSTNGAGGGGGRIALYYENASDFDLAKITAYGGSYTGGTNADRNGGAGTIYLEKKGQSGEIVIANGTVDSKNGTKILAAAPGTLTAIEPYKAVDANASFIPGSLVGMKIRPNLENQNLFTITANTATEIFTEPSEGDMTLVAAVGNRYGFKYPGNFLLESSQITINGNLAFPDLTLIDTTLTLNGSIEVDRLTLQEGSMITHSTATTSFTSSLGIKAREIVIEESSAINVDGCGYLGGYRGGNASKYGRTLGNTNGSYQHAGGGYGGFGGRYSTDLGNSIYGPVDHPVDPGSGGGGISTGDLGGNGGGVIYIETGLLINNGTISANGQSASSAGAGSGGSIQLKIATLSGNGTIAANGGNNTVYAAGGGGRIAVYYEDASDFDLAKITAYGGTYTGGAIVGWNGSAGTIFLEQAGQEARLIIDNNTTPSSYRQIFPSLGPAAITGLSAQVLTDANAAFMPGSLVGMELVPDSSTHRDRTFTIIANDETTITTDPADGDLTAAAAVGNTYRGIAVFDGHLQIRNTTVSDIDGEVWLTDLSVLQGSQLGHPAATTGSVSYLSLKVTGKLTLDATSAINVNARGYLGGYRGGSGSPYGRTLGNTSGSYQYSGGGYGGYGGRYGTNVVNESYGSLYHPVEPGSGGGGSGSPSAYLGGNGGGVICIETDELNNDGTISANGFDATYGGAGSGGSIQLTVKTLKGSGTITASGGNNSYGGSGGGGRIAVYYENAPDFDLTKITAYGGSYTSGSVAARNGGAGTVFLKPSTATYGNLVVDNNSISSRQNSTTLPAVGPGFNTLLEANRLVNAAAPFIPGALTGMKLNPQPTGTTLFTITHNTNSDIFTDSADGDLTQTAGTGGAYIGEHLLFNLTVKGNAQLFTLDRIQVSGTLTVEPGSALKAENHQ